MCKGHGARGQGDWLGKPLTVHVMGEQRAEVEKKLEGPAGPQVGFAGMWTLCRGVAGLDVDFGRPVLDAGCREDLG